MTALTQVRLEPHETGLPTPIVLMAENIAAVEIEPTEWGQSSYYNLTTPEGRARRLPWSCGFVVNAVLVGGGTTEIGYHTASANIRWDEQELFDATRALARGAAEKQMELVLQRLAEA